MTGLIFLPGEKKYLLADSLFLGFFSRLLVCLFFSYSFFVCLLGLFSRYRSHAESFESCAWLIYSAYASGNVIRVDSTNVNGVVEHALVNGGRYRVVLSYQDRSDSHRWAGYVVTRAGFVGNMTRHVADEDFCLAFSL